MVTETEQQILNRQKYFMITIDKINTDVTAYWFAKVFLFIALGIYGRAAIEWLLMKIYAFFIQKASINS